MCNLYFTELAINHWSLISVHRFDVVKSYTYISVYVYIHSYVKCQISKSWDSTSREFATALRDWGRHCTVMSAFTQRKSHVLALFHVGTQITRDSVSLVTLVFGSCCKLKLPYIILQHIKELVYWSALVISEHVSSSALC
jgi:hypothetical protein